jgi:hypothetical protein
MCEQCLNNLTLFNILCTEDCRTAMTGSVRAPKRAEISPRGGK